MKTAVSLPDEIFDAAEELAEKLGLTRSRLYAQAVAEFVAHHRTDHVTERLNKVYSKTEGRLDPVLEELQARSISRDEW